jgi:hypothetical protein
MRSTNKQSLPSGAIRSRRKRFRSPTFLGTTNQMNIGFPSGEQSLKALVAMVLEANMISMAYRVIPQKGHLFSVEMTNLAGKCSLIPGVRDLSEADAWIVQTKRMLHQLDPRDRVTARTTGEG